MNSSNHNRSRHVSVVGITLAMLLSAGAACAATPKHRASKPAPPPEAATLSGSISDATNNAAVFDAEIVVLGTTYSGAKNGTYNISKAPVGQVTVTFQRWGYQPSTQQITIAPGANTLNATLTPKPLTMVQEKGGMIHRFDYELSQFGFLIPFSGYARSDSFDVCLGDGSKVAINKVDLKSVTDFASGSNGCCPNHPVVIATFNFKDGTMGSRAIADSCFYDEYFVGRDRDSGEWAYLKLTDIADVQFP